LVLPDESLDLGERFGIMANPRMAT